MKLLLTGATGFVGKRLAECFEQHGGFEMTYALRQASASCVGRKVVVGNINGDTDWTSALVGQQVIVHAAARAHVMNESGADPLAGYRRVNVQGTVNLARQAAQAGVKRFVFLSSIKVNGEHSDPGQPFRADDKPAPQDPYSISKFEAEQALQRLARETGLEVVIIRPPLIYGPGAKGNFARLTRLVVNGWPLPLGAIDNRRSMIALDNLVDLIVTCAQHPAAANQVFLASDDEDFSTTQLLKATAAAAGRPSRLLPVPPNLLSLAATALGKKAEVQRLLGTLQVDIAKTRDTLGWYPPLGVEQGLRSCFNSRPCPERNLPITKPPETE